MLAAINFNHKPTLPAQEIADKRADRHLAREFETFELAPVQAIPEPALGVRGIVPQLLGAFGRSPDGIGHVQCMPTPSPSRKREGSRLRASRSNSALSAQVKN
jgi:hypothetical protein